MLGGKMEVVRGPYTARLLAVVVLSLGLHGCAVLSPHVTPPDSVDTFEQAQAALDDVQGQYERRFRSEAHIATYSGLGTFVGFGGVGIATLFKGSHDLLLGLSTFGATNLAVAGVYGNKTLQTIYINGSDAVTCIKDTIKPMTSAHNQLKETLAAMTTAEDTTTKYLSTHSATINATQLDSVNQLIAAADGMKIAAQLRFASEDAQAQQIMTALRAVIKAIRIQILNALPNTDALARVGSGLGAASITASTVPSTPSPVRALANDPVLIAYSDSLQSAVTAVGDLLKTPVTLQTINCAAAPAPTAAPLTVSLPAGATNIDVHPMASLSFPIQGGTPPYQKVQWVGTSPPYLTVTVESPNTLHVQPAAGTKATDFHDGDTFSFQLYDAQGASLATPLAIRVISP